MEKEFFLFLVTMGIWLLVYKELLKPSEETKAGKMIPLLLAGIVFTSIITFSLIKNLY